MKTKYKKQCCIKILTILILSSLFLSSCIFLFGFNSFNKVAIAEGEDALIYIGSGSTTNISGGIVSANNNSNSIYIDDGGTLNIDGGTINGNIYNLGTLNYSSGILTSVTLAENKYLTLLNDLQSVVDISMVNPQVGSIVAYLNNESIMVTLNKLNVLNMPNNTELKLVDSNYIKIVSTMQEILIETDPSGYGSVDIQSFDVVNGESVSVVGNTLTYNGITITATASAQTEQYTYVFDGWYVDNVRLADSFVVTQNATIIAKFIRQSRTYTVTILTNNSSYGRVSVSSVKNVPYGATIKRGNLTTQLNVYGTIVTATPAAESFLYNYSFNGWRLGSSSGTTINTTGITLSGNTTIYAVFSRYNEYSLSVGPWYGPSDMTKPDGGTRGTIGGTISYSFAYPHNYTDTGDGGFILWSKYHEAATITATPKAGYTFAGWYDSIFDTVPSSTKSTYSITLSLPDGSAINTWHAFFRATTSTVIKNLSTLQDVSFIAFNTNEMNLENVKLISLDEIKHNYYSYFDYVIFKKEKIYCFETNNKVKTHKL